MDLPNRIECFDNSNIQGAQPVAACVVFIGAKPAKREYRRFSIKSVDGTWTISLPLRKSFPDATNG